MNFQFTPEWCLRMADLEMHTASVPEAGGGALEKAAVTADVLEHEAFYSVAFGRFVELVRRRDRLTIEQLADTARVDIVELVEIETNPHHRPDPRTVFQIAQHFRLPPPKLMQMAKLSEPKDSRLAEEAIRFAARAEPVGDLNDTERAALEAFVAVLSERPAKN